MAGTPLRGGISKGASGAPSRPAGGRAHESATVPQSPSRSAPPEGGDRRGAPRTEEDDAPRGGEEVRSVESDDNVEVEIQPRPRRGAAVEGSDGNGTSPLVAKIKELIKQTPFAKWRRAGEELRSGSLHPHPREIWEYLYAIDIPTGVLVFRSCQPINNEYTRGGYTVTPIGPESFTIETRPRGWTGREITDPFRASSSPKEVRQVLADGQIAADIFRQVRELMRAYQRERKQKFEQESIAIVKALLSGTRSIPFDKWKRVDADAKTLHYQAEIDLVAVEVSRVGNEDDAAYQILLRQEELSFKNFDASTARQFFELIESSATNAKLLELSKLLEGAGF